MSNELVKVAEENGLEKTQVSILTEGFFEMLEQAKEGAIKAKTIIVTDVSQKKEMKEAREIRLALAKIRVDADKLGKAKKEGSLRYGKAVDGIRNLFKDLIEPVEEHLEKQEKFAEIQEELRMEKVNQERIALLSPFVTNITIYNLKEMSEEGFAELLKNSKTAQEAIKAAEKKAEEDRIAKEKAEKEEQERIRVENEKLKKEAFEKEIEAAEQKAKDEVEKKKLEAEKAEVERKLREKEESEKKAEKERIEAEEKAKKEAEAEKERLASASDKEKLATLANSIDALALPEVTNVKAKILLKEVMRDLETIKNKLFGF